MVVVGVSGVPVAATVIRMRKALLDEDPTKRRPRTRTSFLVFGFWELSIAVFFAVQVNWVAALGPTLIGLMMIAAAPGIGRLLDG